MLKALTDRAWSGQPAFLVAGGPSLAAFDFALLRGVPNVLAVNVAFMDCPTSAAMISEDARVFTRFARELADFKGEKIFACPDDAYVAEVKAVVPDVRVIHTRPKSKGWSRRIEDGLSTSSNSCVPAMNLLTVLDANPIYLLGIDCNADPSNYHKDRYPKDWATGRAQMESYKSDFEHWVNPSMRGDGRVIVNLNRDSGVDCWTKTGASYNEAVLAILKASNRVDALRGALCQAPSTS